MTQTDPYLQLVSANIAQASRSVCAGEKCRGGKDIYSRGI